MNIEDGDMMLITIFSILSAIIYLMSFNIYGYPKGSPDYIAFISICNGTLLWFVFIKITNDTND